MVDVLSYGRGQRRRHSTQERELNQQQDACCPFTHVVGEVSSELMFEIELDGEGEGEVVEGVERTIRNFDQNIALCDCSDE